MYTWSTREMVLATSGPAATLMRGLRRLGVLSLFTFTLASCGQFGAQGGIDSRANTIAEEDLWLEGSGTVVWHEVEGGFYAIRHAEKTYEPINLPQEFRTEGMRVYFEAKVREDLAGTHMVGPLIELQTIRQIEANLR